ncbi:MAG: hypothetical protein ACYTGV_04235 [Planctomycetota bacterium]
MRHLRWWFCVLALLAAAQAEDIVHLRNGRMLLGAIVSESETEVVVDVGGGRITLPRAAVRLVERGATKREKRSVVTRRDEWFLVLHRDRLAGWRHVVHTESNHKVQVEERTVFFKPGGGDDIDIRRVETADLQGRPLEFLLMESYGNEMEVLSGQVRKEGLQVRIHRGMQIETKDVELPDGWVLALPAWSRFLHEAKPGEARTVTALDPRRLKTVRLLLRREEDAAAPGPSDTRLCRALSLSGDARRSRALFRPGEGSLAEELNGATLVAHRATRERVELAKRAHAAPAPITIEEAQRYPLVHREKNLNAFHPRTGLRLRAPDAAWIPRVEEAEQGRVLLFERVSLFASVELFVYPLRDEPQGQEECVRRALARLRLTARSVEPLGETVEVTVGGRTAHRMELKARHRGEELRCLLAVIRAKERYVVLIGASPERYWRWARRDFEAFLQSLVVTD